LEKAGNGASTVGSKTTASVSKDKLWDPKYELAINLELASLEGMRVHRPYVAIWVLNADKKPVRQISLWYNKPKYLDEMRSWYATFYEKFLSADNNISSTTSATRSAGKYTLKWDGKDDKGHLVKQGAYTIYIEAAREHGTYQLMSQAITVNKMQHVDLSGNTEVSSASLDFRKKANDN
jgi:thiamine biosynthesis lipoprotein